ncbi:hypothetical protein CDL12_18938 [Handroanthus impetiginosus]|uniref:RRM domain-containing protein n=1 Tax=Handroanthus impetiginosus TaxID=429701 RepID=A0A2G9GT57_9LAMI|nr:hypothetical protein CDL12_18938 [Handroanthus impetiginosus]
MQDQRLKQQQALMQQALIQQQLLYHPGLLVSPQIELIPSGNLPPGFDPSTCRSVFFIFEKMQLTEPLFQDVFANIGPVEGYKLVRKEKSSYAFIHYSDHRCAALAILTVNGRFGQPIKANWAYASAYADHLKFGLSDARVMWDQKTGHSRGFGFVSFWNQQDAINDLIEKWLGSRQICCNWATKDAGTSDDKQNSDAKKDLKEAVSSDAPENNPQYTIVYVGNLAPEAS